MIWSAASKAAACWLVPRPWLQTACRVHSQSSWPSAGARCMHACRPGGAHAGSAAAPEAVPLGQQPRQQRWGWRQQQEPEQAVPGGAAAGVQRRRHGSGPPAAAAQVHRLCACALPPAPVRRGQAGALPHLHVSLSVHLPCSKAPCARFSSPWVPGSE